MNARKISDSTVRRLSLYLNLLRDISAAGTEPDEGLAVRWMDVALELEGLSFLISSAANGSEGM